MFSSTTEDGKKEWHAKFYESCENLGAPKPEYKIIGYGISVRFPTLQSIIITTPKLKMMLWMRLLESRIIAMLRVEPQLTQQDLISRLDYSRRFIQRSMKNRVDTGKIVRISGKRFDH